MSEQTPEPTTASDLHAGGDKPGTDYGASGGSDTAAEDETEAGEVAGGSGDWGVGASGPDGGDSGQRGGGSDPGSGAAVPDEADAAAAQDGVQQAFSVAPQD